MKFPKVLVSALLSLTFAGSLFADTPEIVMAFWAPGFGLKDVGVVQDEINKIVQPKIGATVKLLPIAIPAWQQQINLMMAGGEPLDLVVTGSIPFLSFGTYVARNQLLPLDDLLAKYGQGIKTSMSSDFLGVGSIRGKVYGIPTVRDFASAPGISMRKSLVDKYKIDVTKIKTLEDVGKVLKIIKAGEPSISPTMSGGPNAGMVYFMRSWDDLGDSLGVLPDYGSTLKVTNLFELPDYIAKVKTMRQWYQDGLILPDVATTKDTWQAYVKANKVFSSVAVMKPGYDVQASGEAGEPMVAAVYLPSMATTATTTTVMWSIARSSKNPDKAMQFLNLLYTEPAVINLLDYGVEGKHYVKTADGTFDYPQGVNFGNVGYGPHVNFEFGNQMLSGFWKGDSPTIWKEMTAFNNSARKSKALGFVFDPTPVKTEMASVTNVINQYQTGLECGVLDPDKTLPEFNTKLKAAGLLKIIAEKQKQLDAWAKENNVK